jgi:hypothetical protein
VVFVYGEGPSEIAIRGQMNVIRNEIVFENIVEILWFMYYKWELVMLFPTVVIPSLSLKFLLYEKSHQNCGLDIFG